MRVIVQIDVSGDLARDGFDPRPRGDEPLAEWALRMSRATAWHPYAARVTECNRVHSFEEMTLELHSDSVRLIFGAAATLTLPIEAVASVRDLLNEVLERTGGQ